MHVIDCRREAYDSLVFQRNDEVVSWIGQKFG